MTRVIVRKLAEQDLDAITDYYLGVAGVEVAATFLESWDRALTHLMRHPDSGSTRFAMAAGKAGLRAWPIRRFPYLVFYLHGQDVLDVLRLLHGARDIPVNLRE